MQYPVLLMPWPPRSTELRRIDWPDYIDNPTVGLIVDPATGEPYGDVIKVRVRVLDRPPGHELEDAQVGQLLELPLFDYLTMESQRVDLGRIPWAELLELTVNKKPPPLELQGRRKGLPKEFEEVRQFLFEVLAEGPVSELEVIGRAADRGISPSALREAKNRLRIASVRDHATDYPRTLWRLRMSQSYKLSKKSTPDPKR